MWQRNSWKVEINQAVISAGVIVHAKQLNVRYMKESYSI